MKNSAMNLLLRLNMLLLTVIPLIFSNGCSICEMRTGHQHERTAETPFSAKNMAISMGRGGTNIAFGWLEVPCTIKSRIKSGKSEGPFGIISNTFAATFGAVKGAIWASKRLVGGAVEMVLSPFPPYEPLLHPPYPPCLEPKTNEPEKSRPCDKDSETCPEERHHS